MAIRRMFSKVIVDNDDFLDMPVSARLLYYDLGMRADDDGFVSPRRVMRLTGSSDDDLKVLLTKKYVLMFENKVLVIKDWKVNNFIRPDRYTPTIYQEYLKRLQIENTNQYSLPAAIPAAIPAVDAGKVRLGKVSIGKDINTLSGKPDLEAPVLYLNNKTKRNFNPAKLCNKELVKSRYNEGHTLDDFKQVVNKKVADWLGDEKMSKFLRPSTLFNRTNFENYLNEPVVGGKEWGKVEIL